MWLIVDGIMNWTSVHVADYYIQSGAFEPLPAALTSTLPRATRPNWFGILHNQCIKRSKHATLWYCIQNKTQ